MNDDQEMAPHRYGQLSPPVTFAADVLDVEVGRVRCAARDTAPTSSQTTEAVQEPSIALEPAGRRVSLRQAAQVLLDAWDGPAGSKHNAIDALGGPIYGLRAALATTTLATFRIDPSRTPRNTKQTQVLPTLRLNEGAGGPQIAEAMGWALHTVRGFRQIAPTNKAPRAATPCIVLPV